MNLLMCAPLYDDQGSVRYFIGAPIDVTGLIENGHGIDSFARLLQNDKLTRIRTADELLLTQSTQHRKLYLDRKMRTKYTLDTLQELSTMFSQDESDVVMRNSRGTSDYSDTSFNFSTAPTSAQPRVDRRVLPASLSSSLPIFPLENLSLNHSNPSPSTVYRHYMLIRPYPSLQITFVSPTLRIPGILRAHLFSKLGGPKHTMEELETALRDGVAVTARVTWIPRRRVGERRRIGEERDRGKGRVIRCTPLRGGDGRVGVWMVVLVPDHNSGGGGNGIIGARQKRRYETRSSIIVTSKSVRSSDGDPYESQSSWRGGKISGGQESFAE